MVTGETMKTSVDVEKVLAGCKSIPALPSVVLEANRLLADASTPIEKVSNVLESDAALTSRVLRVANSSYYGMATRVSTLKEAIFVMGFNTVKNIVLTAAVSSMFEEKSGTLFDMEGLWFHSMGCAIASRILVGKNSPSLSDKAYVCGILHDLGKIVIAENLPAEMKEILEKSGQEKDLTWCETEKAVLGFSHPQIGAILAKRWHFPEDYHEAIRLHHGPGIESAAPKDATEKTGSATSLLVHGVYAGNILAKSLGLGKSACHIIADVDPSSLDLLGISGEEFPSLCSQIEDEFRELESSLEVN